MPTPSDERGAFTNRYALAALDEIGRALAGRDEHHVVVVASTVMPGSCEAELAPALERASGRRIGDTLGLCYSPEFIALGNVIRDMLEPDMVLIGESDPRAGDVLERLYKSVCENDPPFRRMSLVNAELTKIAVNTYVTMKISYANALADMCERLPQRGRPGGDRRRRARHPDRQQVSARGDRATADRASRATTRRSPCSRAIWAPRRSSPRRPTRSTSPRPIDSRGSCSRGSSSGDTVGILGLAYKPDSGVIEESPGVALARALGEAGHGVYIYDPIALAAAASELEGVAQPAASVAELLERSDVVVIATPWPEFADLPLDAGQRSGRRLVVIDCWRQLSDEACAGKIDIVRLGQGLHGVDTGLARRKERPWRQRSLPAIRY